MIVVEDDHFTSAYDTLLRLALRRGARMSSRLGSVRDLGPVAIQLAAEGNRLCVYPQRALNPFYALAEAAWVLQGRRDVKSLAAFMQRIRNYSDDGRTFHGAYGYRLKTRIDQVEVAVRMLRTSRDSRRVVLNIWRTTDLGADSLDVPCNIAVLARRVRNTLALTVINRSNDVFRGLPYDVFLFSVLHKHLAVRAGLQLGSQVHFSNTMHLYESDVRRAEALVSGTRPADVRRLVRKLPRLRVDQYATDGFSYALRLRRHAAARRSADPCSVLLHSYSHWRAARHRLALEGLEPDEAGFSAVSWYRRQRGFREAWTPAWYLQIMSRATSQGSRGGRVSSGGARGST